VVPPEFFQAKEVTGEEELIVAVSCVLEQTKEEEFMLTVLVMKGEDNLISLKVDVESKDIAAITLGTSETREPQGKTVLTVL
jgi:hypothetical protein